MFPFSLKAAGAGIIGILIVDTTIWLGMFTTTAVFIDLVKTVRVKGWLRHLPVRKGAKPQLLPRKMRLRYSMESFSCEGTVIADPYEGFEIEVKLPDNCRTGVEILSLTCEHNIKWLSQQNCYRLPIRVEEFRRPEFEVNCTAASSRIFPGELTEVSVEAAYFAGGPLADADVSWKVTPEKGKYAISGWDHFTFGKKQEFSYWHYHDERIEGEVTYQGSSNVKGRHTVALEVGQLPSDEPVELKISAAVEDLNHQKWNSQTSLTVYPAAAVAGLRSSRRFISPGEGFDLFLTAVDLEGRSVAGQRVTLVLQRVEWSPLGRQEEVMFEEELISSGNVLHRCFRELESGCYRAVATLRDEAGNSSQSELDFWVFGRKLSREPRMSGLTILADRESYSPGERVQLMLQSPFAPAEALLTVSNGGIIHYERFRVDECCSQFSFEVDRSAVPSVKVSVHLLGEDPSLFAGDSIEFDVEPVRASAQSGVADGPK